MAGDTALTRRFEPIEVREMTPAATVELLKNLTPKLERHYRVSITAPSGKTAVDLSRRYYSDRFFTGQGHYPAGAGLRHGQNSHLDRGRPRTMKTPSPWSTATCS